MFGVRRIFCGAVAVLCLFGPGLDTNPLGLQQAEAHVREKGRPNGFFWYPGTFNAKYNRVDPINIVITGGGPLTNSWWIDARLSTGMLTAIDRVRFVSDSRQMVGWNRACRGKGCSVLYELQDDALASNNAVKMPRDHIRFWDDSVHHSQFGPGHKYGVFMLGAAHPDHLGHKKRVSSDWYNGKITAIKRFKNYCSWRRWRYRPAAEGTYGGAHYDGIMGRISSGKTTGGCKGK